jgi:phosphoglycerate dehydrogenase-like enzyme
MMNSLVLAPFSKFQLTELQALGRVVYEPWTETQLIYDPEELGIRLRKEKFEILIVEADFIFEELFQAAPNLNFAAICRSALNQVDIEAATAHQVVVVHTPGRNSQAVAEFVLGLMLNMARHISASSLYVSSRKWKDPLDAYTLFQGSELAGKTIGVIGLGEIGLRVARLGNGIGMRVIGYDPYINSKVGQKENIEFSSIETLLRQSDFVSLHVPDNSATRALINGSNLHFMQPTAYLINISSPYAVSDTALSAALENRSVAGAAIDVHESHPIPPNSPYLTAPNVILTPHIGGSTIETVSRHSTMVTNDIQRFLSGRKPKHIANPAVWEVAKTKKKR